MKLRINFQGIFSKFTPLYRCFLCSSSNHPPSHVPLFGGGYEVKVPACLKVHTTGIVMGVDSKEPSQKAAFPQ